MKKRERGGYIERVIREHKEKQKKLAASATPTPPSASPAPRVSASLHAFDAPAKRPRGGVVERARRERRQQNKQRKEAHEKLAAATPTLAAAAPALGVEADEAASIALATFFTPEPHNGETGHQGDNDKVAAFSEQAGSTTTPCLLLSEGSGDGVLGLFQEPTPIAPVAAASSSSDSSGSSSSGGGEQQQEEEQTQGAKHTAPAFTEWMAPSLLATMQDTLGPVLQAEDGVPHPSSALRDVFLLVHHALSHAHSGSDDDDDSRVPRPRPIATRHELQAALESAAGQQALVAAGAEARRREEGRVMVATALRVCVWVGIISSEQLQSIKAQQTQATAAGAPPQQHPSPSPPRMHALPWKLQGLATGSGSVTVQSQPQPPCPHAVIGQKRPAPSSPSPALKRIRLPSPPPPAAAEEQAERVAVAWAAIRRIEAGQSRLFGELEDLVQQLLGTSLPRLEASGGGGGGKKRE